MTFSVDVEGNDVAALNERAWSLARALFEDRPLWQRTFDIVRNEDPESKMNYHAHVVFETMVVGAEF